MAGFVVLLLGLLLTGGAYAALSPATAATSSSSQSDVAKGRQLFLVGCASCHGQNGEGIVTQRNTEYGPPLIGVGAAAVDFQVGTGRMPMARPGVQAAQKKVVYTPEEIRQLAAYVASLGPGPSIPTASQYDTSNATNKQIVRGGQFFETNCTACHNFAAAGGALPGGKFAPSLKGVTNKHIFEALETGPQQMPVFSNGVLHPSEKRDIIAYVKSIEAAPKYGGSTLGSLGPVNEGLFAWLVGIGGCVAFAVWIASHSTRSKKGVKA
ncbi:MAG: cytochrome bc1 complex diheme cytochrome c subunit [Nocardioidaceae bacterium]